MEAALTPIFWILRKLMYNVFIFVTFLFAFFMIILFISASLSILLLFFRSFLLFNIFSYIFQHQAIPRNAFQYCIVIVFMKIFFSW